MPKRVAVLAVNPVNGMGLFQYLEAFYENKIPYTVYAVAQSKRISTNSGIALEADDVIANLKGHEDAYDALIFACGDAMPVFAQHAAEPYNRDLLEVVNAFGAKGKILVGHCAAALLFDMAGIAKGKRVAVHPLAKGALQHATATDAAWETDGNIYTAQQEHTIPFMIDRVVEVLK